MLMIYILGFIVMGVYLGVTDIYNKEEDKITLWEVFLGSTLWFGFPFWYVFDKMMNRKL